MRYKSYDGSVWQSYTHPSRVSENRVKVDYCKLWQAAHIPNSKPSRVRRIK